ncbi:sulfotransferase [Pseudoxanthomonas sp.]|uniref:tetratricopeptide repeat-containing sulfotransferase family protein n=1 Tax=Pseudoxanthomonas sp. TaxID=1871049 RepID=UPI002602E7A5|nr:sulfotransferase [Pseudoxanthomonas sp.]WDS37345.1 MAG: sulfotransferase [Pseudoxanthomonas sp.]
MNGIPPASVFSVLLERAEDSATRGDIAHATQLYSQALDARPEDPYTLVQLSYMHSLSGHYRQAQDFALRAHATATCAPKVLLELIARLRTFNAVPELLECVERMLPASRMPIPLLINTAAHLSYVNLPGQAIKLLDEARRADPDYPTTLLARTQVLTYLGRFHEAEQDAARALKRAPEIAQGWWLQAALRKQQPTSHHVNAIRAQLNRPNRDPSDIALLAFALHKELDDLGDVTGAWEALMLACRAKRSTLRYDISESRQLMQALAAFEPSEIPTTPKKATSAPTPIFIVGMHRSGTTLLEQLLDGSPNVHGIGELYDFTSAMRHVTDHHCRGVVDTTIAERATGVNLTEAGQRYLHGIAWRLRGEAFFTDKLPSNFLNIGFIASALPNAKILHMVRDPVETCFSNLRELFSDANPYSYDLQELAAYHRQYRALMAHWHRRFPGRILDVDYAHLVRKPEEVLRKICGFCGLDFDPAMLELAGRRRGVVTASAVQVRNHIEAREVPKWAPYAEFLAPLIQALGP